jgi:hypothetical protein
MSYRSTPTTVSATGSHGTRSRLWLLAVSAVLVAATGCSEKRVQVFPVTGKVTFDGKVPVGAQVVLHPQGNLVLDNIAPAGTVKDDGSFKITVYKEGDGAPPGDYVATVHWFKIVDDGGGPARGPDVIPKEYSNPDTSPIKVTVKNGETTEVPAIQIAGK